MPSDSRPEQLGHYRIVSRLGAGGMGEVFLATDTRLQRNVAVKLLLAGSAAGDEARRRTLREAQLVATLDHPNVCTIYEIGEHDGQPFIVMQYVQGETLAERMRRAPLTQAETIDVARQVTSALAEAHRRGIVHRDIKPGNIMLSANGAVKVLDFGLAKSFLASSDDATAVMISTPGLVVGTPQYMSPEQLRAEPLDGRTDLFSLGVVLYELAAGARPFDRTTTIGTISAILTEDPPPLANGDFAALEPVIFRALQKSPDRRFATAEAMHDALSSLTSRRRRAAPKTTSAAAPRRRATKKTPAADPAAEKLYLRGRMQWSKRHPEAIRQAIALFQEALELDPLHASSYAGLADAYIMLAFLQVIPPRDVIPKAKASLLRAIELVPNLAEPHASLGYLAGMFDWDWPTAQRELQEAMRLDPRYAWAPHWYGTLIAPHSLDDALRYVTLAHELDPLSPIIHTVVGVVHHLHRDYTQALQTFMQIVDAEAAFGPAHHFIGLTYEQLGEYDAAITHLERAVEITNRGWLALGALGHCYAAAGRRDDALQLLAEAHEQSRTRYISPYNVALIHLGLGDRDAALAWFERALQDRTSLLWHARIEPRFDYLREDATFGELLTRYGIP